MVLQVLEVVDCAAVEDVVPAADVEDRNLDVLAVRGHGDAVPAHVVQRAATRLVQGLLRHALLGQPANGVLLLQHAARVAVRETVGRRDDHIGRLQVRRRGQGGGVGGDSQGRAAGHADLAVAPGLGGRPLDRVVAVLDVVLERLVEALGAPLPAHVLHHVDVAGVGVAPRLLGHALAGLGRLLRDAAVLEIGGAGQDDRPRPLPGRLIDVGGEADAVAQGHEFLDGARRQARPFLGPGGRGRLFLGQGRLERRARQDQRGRRGQRQLTPVVHESSLVPRGSSRPHPGCSRPSKHGFEAPSFPLRNPAAKTRHGPRTRRIARRRRPSGAIP